MSNFEAIELTDKSCKHLALALTHLAMLQEQLYKASYLFDEATKVSESKDCMHYQQMSIGVKQMLYTVGVKTKEVEGLLSIDPVVKMVSRGVDILEGENFDPETTQHN